jgi:GR25 family glycosyltransferase involved in LPS biosynthesis
MKKIWIFSLFLCIAHADLEDHFKKAHGKTDVHSMRGIDFIYMINLDERPEKFAITRERFQKYDIIPYRFSAVNGWKLPLSTIDELGVRFGPWLGGGKMGTYYLVDGDGSPQHEIVRKFGKTYFSHCMSRGAIGICLSHLSVLQDALDSGYETIWVMEDDVEIVQDPHLISDLIEKLDRAVGKEGWDVLFTDRDTRNSYGQYVPCTDYAWRPNYTPPSREHFAMRYEIDENFRCVGARFGAYSMIVRRSGMEKVLDFFKNYDIFLPYDIDFTQPPGIRLYTVLDDVVIPWTEALSDNGAPGYE